MMTAVGGAAAEVGGMYPPDADERVASAWKHYRRCTLCEHRCGVDRVAPAVAGGAMGEQGGAAQIPGVRPATPASGAKCHASSAARVFRNRVECGEESFLNPCHLFYLSGCDLRCVFCINQLSAFDATRGELLTPRFFREAVARGKERGARTLQWVGGEPTIHLPTILHAMAGTPGLPPVVWKSDFHFTPEALELLRGVVDVFVADFKFGNDACAHRLSGIRGYVEIVMRNLMAAHRQARLVVRHLLLPGHEACCWQPIARWMAANLPEVEVSIRGGYLPRWRASAFPELAAPLDRQAFPDAQATARRYALRVIA